MYNLYGSGINVILDNLNAIDLLDILPVTGDINGLNGSSELSVNDINLLPIVDDLVGLAPLLL